MPLFLFLVPLLIPFVFKSTQKVVPTRLFFSLWYHFLQSLPFASQIFPAKYTNTTAQKLRLSQNSALTVSLFLCLSISLSIYLSVSFYSFYRFFRKTSCSIVIFVSRIHCFNSSNIPASFPAIFRGFPVLISHHIPPESLCKSFPCP